MQEVRPNPNSEIGLRRLNCTKYDDENHDDNYDDDDNEVMLPNDL